MKRILSLALCLFVASCTTTIPRQNPVGSPFPTVSGKGLDGKNWTLPKDLSGRFVVLLVGYKQKSQFDIDRWLIGMDMKGVKVDLLEVPTIAGWVPRLFSSRIDSGMRSGIPPDVWKAVVTVYDDAYRIVELTGNEDPRNARVLLLDGKGQVVYFHDRGFSVPALNKLIDAIPGAKPAKCD